MIHQTEHVIASSRSPPARRPEKSDFRGFDYPDQPFLRRAQPGRGFIALAPVMGDEHLRHSPLFVAGGGSAGPGWSIGRTQRIQSGFYTSQALELVRHG